MSYVLSGDGDFGFEDHVNKTENGNPAIRILVFNTLTNNPTTTVELMEKSKVIHGFTVTKLKPYSAQNSVIADVNAGTYDISVNGKVINSITMKLGGVYTLQAYVSEDLVETHLSTVTPPNSIHILWLIPQYIILTTGEVLFSVTGLEFAFTQAPTSMKSLLQAGWLLTVAFGNLIVVIVAEAKIFSSQVKKLSLFC